MSKETFGFIPHWVLPEHFQGRTQELNDLSEWLRAGASVLVWGLGGIGKTTLASEFLRQKGGSWEALLWIHFQGSLELSVQASLEAHPHAWRELPGKNWPDLWRFLNSLRSPKLLVCDACPDLQTLHQLQELFPGWQVLALARQPLEGTAQTLALGSLEAREARKLFWQHLTHTVPQANPDEWLEHLGGEAALKDLLQEIGWHSLLITLCARLCAKVYQKDYFQTLTRALGEHRLAEVREQVINPEYPQPSPPALGLWGKFTSLWKAPPVRRLPQQTTLQAMLQTLHDLRPLHEAHLRVLKLFALWPPESEVRREDFLSLGFDPSQTPETLYDTLGNLLEYGWIWRTSHNHFVCHAMTHLFIWDRFPPRWEEVEPILPRLQEILGVEHFAPVAADSLEAQAVAEPLEALAASRAERERLAAQASAKPSRERQQTAEASAERTRELQQARQQQARFLSLTQALLERFPEVETLEVGELAQNLGKRQQELGTLIKAKSALERAARILPHYWPADSLPISTLYYDLADIHWSLGEYAAARTNAVLSLRIRQILSPPVPLHIAQSDSLLGMIENASGNLPQAQTYLQEAIQITQTLPGQETNLATSYNNLASVLQALGELEPAKEYQLQALAIQEAVLPANHPHLAQSYNNLALVLQALGELEPAKAYALQALAIQEAVLPANHPHLAQSYNNLASVLQALGELEPAKAYALQALAIREAVLPANHPHLASSYNNLALTHHALGELEPAKKYALQALAIREAVLPANHPDLAQGYHNLAGVLRTLGELEPAKKYQLQALAIREAVLPANHPHLAQSYNNLASVLQALGEWTEAEALFQKAIGILEAIFPNGHPDLNLYRNNYRIFQEERTAAGK